MYNPIRAPCLIRVVRGWFLSSGTSRGVREAFHEATPAAHPQGGVSGRESELRTWGLRGFGGYAPGILLWLIFIICFIVILIIYCGAVVLERK